VVTSYLVLSVGSDDLHAWRAAALASALPRAELMRIESASVRRLPAAAALITATPEDARVARATGFAGGIVLHGFQPGDDDVGAARALGAIAVDGPATPASLADALASAIPLGQDGNPAPVHDDVARTRRLLAAGEIALTLQHTLNNPLGALLAEVQLLEMDAPNEEVREAAVRIVALARRLMEALRVLDGVRERVSPL
jgi:signal transduction histidine kinase